MATSKIDGERAIGSEPIAEQNAEEEQPAMESAAEPIMARKTEKEQPTAAGMQPAGTFIFIEPVRFEEQTYEQVDYDLTKLRSKDVMAARRQASYMRGQADDPSSLMEDDLLHATLFALAANLPDVFVLEMGAADYIAWASAAQGFFARALRSLVS